MTTLKNSSTNAKNGNKQKGIAYFEAMLLVYQEQGDHTQAENMKKIIKRLKSDDVRKEKEKKS